MKNKTKSIFIFSIIICLVLPSIIQNTGSIKDTNLMKNSNLILINDEIYEPKNITPTDVSYHPSTETFTLQWWYFEGIFDNGYNAIVNLIIWSKAPIGICISHIQLFHKAAPNVYFTKREIQPLNRLTASETYPDISFNGKQIVEFKKEEYNNSKTWNYHITFEIDGNAVDLIFKGLTPGWQGNTLEGFYGPVLPMADVTGTILFQNETIEVNGLGYHEHAHEITFPVKEWGWYWGKIVGDTSSLFWGKMMNTQWDEQARAGVFSIINQSYVNINPSTINIELYDYEFHEKRFIPTRFIFNVSDPENNLNINVSMKSIHVYHLPFGFYNYWRYLLNINGEIIYKNKKEELINKTQIMELMRFR